MLATGTDGTTRGTTDTQHTRPEVMATLPELGEIGHFARAHTPSKPDDHSLTVPKFGRTYLLDALLA
eukprot:4931418-Prymnesium_polylepis.1